MIKLSNQFVRHVDGWTRFYLLQHSSLSKSIFLLFRASSHCVAVIPRRVSLCDNSIAHRSLEIKTALIRRYSRYSGYKKLKNSWKKRFAVIRSCDSRRMSLSINLNLLVRLRRPCSAIHSSRTTTIGTEATIKQCEIKLVRFSVNDPTERSAAACDSRPSDRFEGKNRWEFQFAAPIEPGLGRSARLKTHSANLSEFLRKRMPNTEFSFRRFPTVWK